VGKGSKGLSHQAKGAAGRGKRGEFKRGGEGGGWGSRDEIRKGGGEASDSSDLRRELKLVEKKGEKSLGLNAGALGP